MVVCVHQTEAVKECLCPLVSSGVDQGQPLAAFSMGSRMNQGDKALESIIAQLTSAIAMTSDPRLVKLQQQAVAMRSHQQVAHMEKAKGLTVSRNVVRDWR